jgi:hypothetical protein
MLWPPVELKLSNWRYKGEVKFVFCRYGIEDRGQFFFLCVCVCAFSSRVQKHDMGLCNVLNHPTIWDDIVDLGM